MPFTKKPRVLFLDLDGTVRKGKDELGRFVNTAADVEVFPEVPEILKKYRSLGWIIVGITNQGGVALGFITEETLSRINKETDRQCGEVFDGIGACTHDPNGSCWCRKPRPGMIFGALHLLQRSSPMLPALPTLPTLPTPEDCLLVGDRPEDQQCAASVGMPFMWAKEWREGGYDRHLRSVCAPR